MGEIRLKENTFNLSENAIKQFENLYCLNSEDIVKTFKRVSKEFAKDDEQEELAFNLLCSNIWRPNTPVFLNAGSDHKVFSACYVTGLEDSMESIYDVVSLSRKIFQFGAGIGIPIGNLREKEAYIYEGNISKSPEGRSSGPITFMKLFDAVGETTKSGGRVRRAAILCSMPVWHPDIMDFISCKEQDGRLANMNISVNITDTFMKALEDGVSIDLISPNGGKRVGTVNAQDVWDRISDMSWKSADPGIIFIDNMNKYNPLIKRYLIEATNPCGEQPLLPFGCCNLSAINISKFIINGEFDWDLLYNTTFNVMGLMDNIIDNMEFPEECSKPEPKIDRFRQTAEKYRQVGIGLMGLADTLYMLGLRYDGPEGRKFAGKVMKVMTTACVHKSALLAQEHGPFYEYNVHKEDMERILYEHMGVGETDDLELTGKIKAVWDLVKEYGVRNSQFTTCQPTGCLKGDTLISGNSFGVSEIGGLINSYSSGDVVDYSTKTKSDNGEYTYKKWFDKGFQPTRKIITKRGYEIEGTLDHKIRVVKDNQYIWKRIGDINPDDYIVMRKNFISDNKMEMASSLGKEPLIYPNEIAEFIGYYMADGWHTIERRENKEYGRLYLSVNKEDELYVDKLLKTLNKWFSFNVFKREHGENCFKYDISCNDMYIQLFKNKQMLKNGSNNAYIPKFIMESKSAILNFIRGYFKGDGCVTDRDGEITFTTTSQVMARQLQTLLLGIGIPSKKKFYKKSNEKIIIEDREVNQNYDVYKIVINNFYSIILSKKVGIEIKNLDRKNIHEKILVTEDILHKVNKKDIRVSESGFSWISYDKCNFSNWFTENELMLEKVVDNVDTGLNLVYDMEIEEEGHTYIANGFVTHNTTALSCDASYGIEPIFGLVFYKNYIDGNIGTIVNPIFHEKFKNEEWYTTELLEKIVKNKGSLKGIRGIPEDVRKVFVTAHDIHYKSRVDMQAEIQKYCSTAISSTVNLPKETTKDEIADLYKYAWQKGLKGITIYRDGSKMFQPVTFEKNEKSSLNTELKELPSKMCSTRYKIETGNGGMYVNISDYKGNPLEVFLYLGKSGQILNTFSEAMGRLISIALQSGVPVESISKTLIGINSDKPTWYRLEPTDKKPTQILSIPDGIGKLLNRYYSGKRYEGELSGEVCPKCKQNTYRPIEGCWTCVKEEGGCGYSKCS